MVEGGVLERGEDTSSIGSAKEQTDAEGEAMEDFLKSKIGKGLTREDIKSIFTALLLRENHDFPSSGFQNKTSFLFETRQPRTHVRVLG